MNIAETFIRRPIATSLLMLGIGGIGVVAYAVLPVGDLPNIALPTLNVSATMPGTDPTTMAAAVASALERQFTTIAGLDEMTSSSSAGVSNITLQFDLHRDIDSAAVDVQTAISAAMPLLPPGMPAPPSFRKFNPADQPIMFLDLESDLVPLYVLNDYAETLIAPRISTVTGVAQVQVTGAQRYAVRVQVDPEKLHALNLGLNEVNRALQSWNVNMPTGQLWGRRVAYNIKVAGQLMDASAFRSLVVAYRHAAPIRLDQVATILDTVEDTRQAAWVYNKGGAGRAIYLSVMRQPSSNTIEVIDAIRRILPSIEAALPPAVHLTTPDSGFDLSRTIRQAFRDIQWTMLVTLGLVVGVIFVFLRSGWATLIPALALPFSIFGTFAVMKVLDFSLNNLSMMALILSIGFVVDDAIVMLENIVRHMEGGEPRLQAALNGSREIGFTIVSMTISLAAVFLPILFMGGILGRLLREFAVTITSAILISGVVSVTLTPMLCSRFLRPTVLRSRGRLAVWLEGLFQLGLREYERSLSCALRHRRLVLALFVAVLIATAWMFNVIPKGFIPDQDNDFLNVTILSGEGTSFYDMVGAVTQIAPIIKANPNVSEVFSTTGGNGPMNRASFSVSLTPRVVYIVLGMLYESFIHPITILSGLPSAGLGALITLKVFGNELNIYSFVGLMMLVGIVKKNAIMQIDFALQAERQRGKTPTEAIYEGCLIRFRPIMMTTMAALLWSVPIALGLGTGGEARPSGSRSSAGCSSRS